MKPCIIFILFVFAAILGSHCVVYGSEGDHDTDTWIVQLKDDVSPEEFASQHGLRHMGVYTPLKGIGNYHEFEASHTHRVDYHRTRIARALKDPQSGAEWAERQVARKRYKRNESFLANSPRVGSTRSGDPMWGQQWHLHGNPVASVGITPDYHRKGNGVMIGIVDDGLQHSHPELTHRYDRARSWDFNGNDADPAPSHMDGHGTSAAGVAVGEANNGHCGQGVAPLAKVAGIRAVAGPVTDATEASALSHYANKIDIYSCSWGPMDSGTDMQEPGHLVKQVFANYAGRKRGRNGKGSIYVWASGNGRTHQDSCAYDGYANSPYTIAVGAINNVGRRSWYSEGCAALMCVAPSSGNGKGIVTADLTGSSGYDAGECTSNFGGTSSAAPLAAGVIALMLEERPELTWRDVQHVIAKGATVINPHDKSWSPENNRKYRHSNSYGFGRLEINKILQTARQHSMVPNQKGHTSGVQTAPTVGAWSIPDTPGQSYTHTISLANSHITFVEHVLLNVYITHPRRGEVAIYLRSPSGVTSTLAERRGDHHSNYPSNGWMYTSVHHWGEQKADGEWTIIFVDQIGHNNYRSSGYVNWIKLSVYGY